MTRPVKFDTYDDACKMLKPVRDILLGWLDAHREVCADPNCCEPANLLGWFAHCLGFKAEHIDKFRDELARYEAECVCRKGEPH